MRLQEATLTQVSKLFIKNFMEPMVSKSKKDKRAVYDSANVILSKAFKELDEYRNLNYAAQVTHMIEHLKNNPNEEELKAWKNHVYWKSSEEMGDEAAELSIKTWLNSDQAEEVLDIIYEKALEAEDVRKYMEKTDCSVAEALKHFKIVDLRVVKAESRKRRSNLREAKYLNKDITPKKIKYSTHSDDGFFELCRVKILDDLLKKDKKVMEFFDFWNWCAEVGSKDLVELICHDFEDGNLKKDSCVVSFYNVYKDLKDKANDDAESFVKEYGGGYESKLKKKKEFADALK